MKTSTIALAAVLAFSGTAFAKDISGTTVPQTDSTYSFERFIDPTTTGSIVQAPRDDSASDRLGGGVDPSVLPNF